ncbi:MAG: hypothetical protein WAU86_10410 [Oricola sp.]
MNPQYFDVKVGPISSSEGGRTMAGSAKAVILANGHSRVKRAMLAIAGLIAIILPVWDLWPSFHSLTFATLFFGVIAAGAAMIGMGFLYSAIIGETTRLTADSGRIVGERANCLRRRAGTLAPDDIASVSVRAIDWDSRADTWSVVVTTHRGETFQSADFGARDKADALKAEFEAAAGMR